MEEQPAQYAAPVYYTDALLDDRRSATHVHASSGSPQAQRRRGLSRQLLPVVAGAGLVATVGVVNLLRDVFGNKDSDSSQQYLEEEEEEPAGYAPLPGQARASRGTSHDAEGTPRTQTDTPRRRRRRRRGNRGGGFFRTFAVGFAASFLSNFIPQPGHINSAVANALGGEVAMTSSEIARRDRDLQREVAAERKRRAQAVAEEARQRKAAEKEERLRLAKVAEEERKRVAAAAAEEGRRRRAAAAEEERQRRAAEEEERRHKAALIVAERARAEETERRRVEEELRVGEELRRTADEARKAAAAAAPPDAYTPAAAAAPPAELVALAQPLPVESYPPAEDSYLDLYLDGYDDDDVPPLAVAGAAVGIGLLGVLVLRMLRGGRKSPSGGGGSSSGSKRAGDAQGKGDMDSADESETAGAAGKAHAVTERSLVPVAVPEDEIEEEWDDGEEWDEEHTAWKETGGMFVEDGEDWQDEFGGETDEDAEEESVFSEN